MSLATRNVIDKPMARPWGSLVVLGVIVLGGLLLGTTDGERVHLRGWPAAVFPEVCWSKRWLGWNCPLCGATRSVIALMRGEWVESWQRQPAGILTVATAGIAAAVAWSGYWLGPRTRWTVAWLTQTLWAGLLVFLIVRHAWMTAWGTETAANSGPPHALGSPVR